MIVTVGVSINGYCQHCVVRAQNISARSLAVGTQCPGCGRVAELEPGVAGSSRGYWREPTAMEMMAMVIDEDNMPRKNGGPPPLTVELPDFDDSGCHAECGPKRLRALRESVGLSQAGLAEVIEIGPSVVGEFEKRPEGTTRNWSRRALVYMESLGARVEEEDF